MSGRTSTRTHSAAWTSVELRLDTARGERTAWSRGAASLAMEHMFDPLINGTTWRSLSGTYVRTRPQPHEPWPHVSEHHHPRSLCMARIKARLAIPVAAALCAVFAVGACSSSSRRRRRSADNCTGDPDLLGHLRQRRQQGPDRRRSAGQLIPAFEKQHTQHQGQLRRHPVRLAAAEADHQRGRRQAARPDPLGHQAGCRSSPALGVFAQLDGKMPNFDALSKATTPARWPRTAWHGHYYGLPLDTNTRVLITNQTALTSAGITAPPATFRICSPTRRSWPRRRSPSSPTAGCRAGTSCRGSGPVVGTSPTPT